MKRICFSLLLLSLCSLGYPALNGVGSVAGTYLTGFAGCDEEASLQFYTFLAMTLRKRYGPVEGHGIQDHAISVGRNGVIFMRDGGPTEPWIQVPSGVTVDLNYVKMYDSPDSSIAFAVGDSGTVLRSDDWGHTWSNRSIPSEIRNLRGLDFFSYFSQFTVHIVVSGDSGLVMKSTNMGGNWTWVDVSFPTIFRFYSVGAISADWILAAGEYGIMERTTDGGATWHTAYSLIGDDIHRVFVSRFYPDFNRMWAVADSGKIVGSIDYGYSWTVQSSGTMENLHDVLFRNSNEGIVVGDHGTVRYTVDGGITWLTDPYFDELTTRDIISVGLLDSVTVEAITHSSSADASSTDTTYFLAVSAEPLTAITEPPTIHPQSFVLEQNYPNPFNPVTTFAFTIPYSSFVTLSIYTLLGREVATLVDEKLSPGRYERTFDARRLASGVYLYRLQIRPTDGSEGRSFSEVRKLVLLR